MYDLSSKFNTFYRKHVVLSGDEQTELYEKGRINIERLKGGLIDYNAQNGTSYKIKSHIVQGSMAMNTAVQNDQDDYDIDIAIIFTKENIGDIGYIAVKNMVVDAITPKCQNFKTPPEAKTNCVRIQYNDCYHIDFAIYRRDVDWFGNITYYHAGNQWSRRNPRAINDWFANEMRIKGDKLRKVIRLSKMFCKSRNWDMPGGLIQTVLCDECFCYHDRLDECFYYTMSAIRDRLTWNKEINNPTDPTLSLLQTEAHRRRINNYHDRLNSYLKKLSPLFGDDCTKETALTLWGDFFNHSYWAGEIQDASAKQFALESRQSNTITTYRDTETFIEDMMPVEIEYDAKITATAWGNGFTEKTLDWFLTKFNKFMPHKFRIRFTCNHNVPEPVQYYWKVKNVGKVAERRDCIRGQVEKKTKVITEPTNFYGPHYVECYVVKDDVCKARARISVPIGDR